MTRSRRLSHLVAPTYAIRLTIPAREALEREGNTIDRPPSAEGVPVVTLRRPPMYMVVVAIIGTDALAARLPEEPHVLASMSPPISLIPFLRGRFRQGEVPRLPEWLSATLRS